MAAWSFYRHEALLSYRYNDRMLLKLCMTAFPHGRYLLKCKAYGTFVMEGGYSYRPVVFRLKSPWLCHSGHHQTRNLLLPAGLRL